MRSSSGEKIRILAVDKDPSILDIYQRALGTETLEVHDADFQEELPTRRETNGEAPKTRYYRFDLVVCRQMRDGFDALALRDNEPLAVAFIGAGMSPNSDGARAARQIRRQDPFVEIVMVTDRFDGNAPPTCWQDLPGNEPLYLQKPFHPLEIRQLTRNLAAKWRLEAQLRNNQQVLELRIGERSRERLNSQLQHDIAQRQSVERTLRVGEEKFRNIVENISDFICVHDLNGKILESNLTFKQYVGYSPKDMADMHLQQLIPERYLDEFHDYLHRIRINEKDEGCMAIKAKDGREIVIEYKNKLVQTPQGEYEVHGLGRDITERLKIEQALKRSETLYRMLFEHAHDGIFVLIDGFVRFANPSTTQLLQYSMKELEEIPCDQLIHAEDREMVLQWIEDKLQELDAISCLSFRSVNRHGEPLCLQLTAIRVIWEGQEALLCFARDITEIKALEQQLIQAQKMEALGTLSSGIAHDFNNILSVIMGYTQLSILDIPVDSRSSEQLAHVLRAANRAKELVSQILTFSRPQDQERKPVMIRLIVKEAMKLLRASIPATISFKEEIQENVGAVNADPTEIHQVLMNLCTNAAYAMRETGGTLHIRLESMGITSDESRDPLMTGNYVRLTVGDTGCGMDETVLKNIFDPYFTTKKMGEGTGLGLSVVHGIIKSLDGKIEVTSQEGKGTTFTVYFPKSADTEKKSGT